MKIKNLNLKLSAGSASLACPECGTVASAIAKETMVQIVKSILDYASRILDGAGCDRCRKAVSDVLKTQAITSLLLNPDLDRFAECNVVSCHGGNGSRRPLHPGERLE